MRGLWVTKNGGLEALEVRTSPMPAPQKAQIRLRVHSAGLNFSEILIRQGLYADSPALPAVLGYEAAGIVDAVSDDVAWPTVGTRVVMRTKFGAHAEYVCAGCAAGAGRFGW